MQGSESTAEVARERNEQHAVSDQQQKRRLRGHGHSLQPRRSSLVEMASSANIVCGCSYLGKRGQAKKEEQILDDVNN